MKALIDYNGVRTFEDTLEIDDIGNCAIRCEGKFRDGKITFDGDYYIIVKTTMGFTSIMKFGPVVPDLKDMQQGFDASFKKIAFKEPAIKREISMFINDGLKCISGAEIIDPCEALAQFPDPIATLEDA